MITEVQRAQVQAYRIRIGRNEPTDAVFDKSEIDSIAGSKTSSRRIFMIDRSVLRLHVMTVTKTRAAAAKPPNAN